MRVLLRPYPDELLYSALGRTAYHFGYLSPKQLLLGLYGNRGVLAVPDLPCNLEALGEATAIFWNLTPEQLAMHHTLVGYYTHFQGCEARRQVLDDMRSKGAHLQLRLGICAGSALSPRRFRMCLKCRDEDRLLYGESYWHRSHHLPGVLVCDRHGDVLMETQVPFRPTGRHEHVAVPMEGAEEKMRPLVGTLEKPEVARSLAAQAAALLSRPALADETLLDYRMALKVCGFSGGQGGANRLREAFRRYFGADLLAASFRPSESLESLQWLAEVLRRPRRPMHPYRHLLVSTFIASRLGAYDAPAVISIQKFSRQWGLYRDPKLRADAGAMAHQGYRTHAIARALDVDWKTAARLLEPLNEPVARGKQEDGIDREAWSALACSNPALGKKGLRRMSPALYARLYRNDRAWLVDWKTARSTPSPSLRRVDWDSRDRNAAALIRQQADKALQLSPPRRASRSYILGVLGMRTLLARKPELMPLSIQTLREVGETVQAFQTRRLRFVLAECEGTSIRDWMVLRRAALNPARFTDGGLILLAETRLSMRGTSHVV